MKLYHLYVSSWDDWVWECHIEAADHVQALHKAIAHLDRVPRTCAIRLVPDEDHAPETFAA